MQGHDESPCSDIIGKPGEADEDDGGHVVDDLFLEILSLDVRGDAEEQGPVEGEFDHVVPVLGRDDALDGISFPHFPQVVEPRFIHNDSHASNEGNQVKCESPAGFSKLLKKTGPVLVAAAAEPALYLAARQPALPGQQLYLCLLGLLAAGQVEMLQGGIGRGPKSRLLLDVQEGCQGSGHVKLKEVSNDEEDQSEG